jgi:hypothetical protein
LFCLRCFVLEPSKKVMRVLSGRPVDVAVGMWMPTSATLRELMAVKDSMAPSEEPFVAMLVVLGVAADGVCRHVTRNAAAASLIVRGWEGLSDHSPDVLGCGRGGILGAHCACVSGTADDDLRSELAREAR